MISLPLPVAVEFDRNDFAFPMIADDKIDGIRVRVEVKLADLAEPAGYIRFFSREGQMLHSLAHLAREVLMLAKVMGLTDGVLDCEATNGPTHSDALALLGNRLQPAAVLHVFDYHDKLWPDTTLSGRKRHLREAFNELANSERSSLALVPVDYRWVWSGQEADEAFESALARRHEGVVYKDAESLYTESGAWMKRKRIVTIDVPVVGIPASPSVPNSAKGVSVQLPGGSVQTVTAGLSYAEKARLWQQKHSMIGCIAEIAYDTLTPAGALRSARFIRWRPDKR